MEATDFREAQIKDGKQAEFLVFGSFPWPLVEKIGVANPAILSQVEVALTIAEHQPLVSIEPGWYY